MVFPNLSSKIDRVLNRFWAWTVVRDEPAPLVNLTVTVESSNPPAAEGLPEFISSRRNAVFVPWLIFCGATDAATAVEIAPSYVTSVRSIGAARPEPVHVVKGDIAVPNEPCDPKSPSEAEG